MSGSRSDARHAGFASLYMLAGGTVVASQPNPFQSAYLLSIISNDAALKSCDISSDSESCFPRPNTFKEALFIENHDDVTHQPSHTVAAPETNPFFINAVPQQNARLPAFVALSALESLDPHHECALASSSSYTFDNCGLGDDTKPEILLPVTRSRHQPDRNALLKEWLHIHASYPYPTGAEIEAFAQADGRTKHQIQVAFRNLRQRMDAPCPKDLLPYEASGFSPIQTSDVASQNIESLSMSQDCSGDGFSFSEGEVTWSNYPWSYDFLNATIEDNTTWHQIEQDRTDITCTSSSSPSNADNKAMLQAAAPKRKGKKRHALRSDPINSQQQHDVDVNTNHDDKKEKAQSAQQYQCTTCRQSFSKPFDWRRHEEGVHWHIDTLWICKLHETTILGTHCIFCSDLILDLYHLEEHDIQVCDADHRFSRKDLLKQHVQQVHLKTSRAAVRRGFSVPLSWISPVGAGDVVPNALWCGFCMLEFEFVEERMEHVKHHFKAGSSMEFWMAKDQL